MSVSQYASFIERKRKYHANEGISVSRSNLHQSLFGYQRDITAWAIRKGKACIFAATGLGKTRMQVEFAKLTSGDGYGLIVAPLAVGWQTSHEAELMGYQFPVIRDQSDIHAPGVYIVNYERLHLIDTSLFNSVVLDESSILKGFDGKTRQTITEAFSRTRYKLACTTTPAPNDHIELGTHAEFVGAMSRSEMLATYFVHDGGDTSKWRLKRHAIDPFWDWVTTWAAFITKPSDLGYSDTSHELPPLHIVEHVVDGVYKPTDDGALFQFGALSATKIHDHMRETSGARCERMINEADMHDPFLVWCFTNYDQDLFRGRLDRMIDVRGSDSADSKESKLKKFTDDGGRMVTKPSIAGFGLNWQHCNQMGFAGLSYSWEAVHQAIRRCYRFGQKKPVYVHFVSADTEASIADVLKRKEDQYAEMSIRMIAAMGRKMEEFKK